MGSNALSTQIEKKLAILTQIGKECCMYKVHELLRDVNQKAYKPMLLAIGPYHHGNVGQGLMEEHKLRYLQHMLERTRGSVEAYITALRELEETARKCYVERISQSQDEFVEMMLLDGCFIIELFWKNEIDKGKKEYDPIFQTEWMLSIIARDLLLFENQLPLFVLAKLFDMSESNGSRTHIEEKDGISVGSSTSIDQFIQTQLNDRALCFFSYRLPFKGIAHPSSYNSTEKVEHPLCLTNEAITPSPLEMMVNQRSKFGLKFKNAEFEHLLGLIYASICISILDSEIDHAKECQEARLCLDTGYGSNLHSATELEEAGVKIKVGEYKLISIKFNNGLMEISPLSIEDYTETYLRNLIAYEQYCDPKNGFNYVINYVHFMDSLINSSKDVELLRRKGIIDNFLGDDEIISTMVNKLGHYVSVRSPNHIYTRTSMNLDMHCRRHCNVWMTKLRHDYFNSPWSLLSFLAAVLLFALAIAQTIFSIIH